MRRPTTASPSRASPEREGSALWARTRAFSANAHHGRGGRRPRCFSLLRWGRHGWGQLWRRGARQRRRRQ
eukprot:1097610-Pyramimonas_sp.AAC.1